MNRLVFEFNDDGDLLRAKQGGNVNKNDLFITGLAIIRGLFISSDDVHKAEIIQCTKEMVIELEAMITEK